MLTKIQRRRGGGFTLIELLAVIAIILLLASLLLPALDRIRDQTLAVVCASNVRSVMAAIVQQSSDNNGHLTSPNWGTADQYGWLSRISKWTDNRAVEGGLLWPYLGNHRIYRCPADPQPDVGDTLRVTWWPNDTRMVTSYNMNGSVCGFGAKGFLGGTNGWNTHRMSEFKPTDVIFWEGNDKAPSQGYWHDGANYPWEGLTSRHRESGTMASMDGHVEKISSNEFYRMGNDMVNRNRLWNNPGKANGHN